MLVTTKLSAAPLFLSFCVLCICVCPCVEARGQRWVSSSVAFHVVKSQGLSLNLKLKGSARLVGQGAPETSAPHLCLSSTEITGVRLLMWVQRTRTQFLMLSRISHFPIAGMHLHTSPAAASSVLGLHARKHPTQLLECRHC